MAKQQIATFLGGNKGLSFAGKHAYAYSGIVGVTGTTDPTTLLDFQTGKKIIKCIVQFHYSILSGDDITYTIKFNGEVVVRYLTSESVSTAIKSAEAIYLILPPLTRVECLALNTSATTARDHTVTLRGTVYA